MSDDDLIRRGDALAVVQEWTYCCDAENAIAALPPAKQDDLASGKAVTGGAAALLKDVPRHSLDFCDRMEIDKDGVWMHEDHVLAALEPVAAPDRIWVDDDTWFSKPVTYPNAVEYLRADAVAARLSDPVTVHANMLRGTIAKPTVEQIIHLYGVDALAKALASIEYERKVAQMKKDFPNGI